MSRADDNFFQTAIRKTAAGEQRTQSRIDLVYGEAPNDEVYFSWRGDRLYELPVAWLHPVGDWGSASFDPEAEDFSREVLARCLECHNTWFEHIPGTTNQYRRDSFQLGVTCEKCHGPGREHIEHHRGNPAAQAATFIVHPGDLPRERQMEVCAQCHSNAMKHRRPPNTYRPGEPLDVYFRTLITRYPEDDRVANQVEYLRESKCFQKSDSLTCISCHDPHRPKAANPPSSGFETCSACHAPDDCRERPRLPGAVKDNCVGCHMPLRSKIQVNFHTAKDPYIAPVKRWEHRIGVYPEARDELLLAWRRTQSDDAGSEEAARLARSLAQHWMQVAEERVREYRFVAAIDACRESLRFAPESPARDKLPAYIAIQEKLDSDWRLANRLLQEQRHAEAIEVLTGILTVKPDWADVHGKLGTLYATTGKRDLATQHLELVARYDPDSPYGHSMLGWLALLDGRLEESLEHYRAADEVEPRNAEINARWGMVLVRLERWSEAVERFRQVLALEPDHIEGALGLAHALSRQGEMDEAVKCALRAAELTGFQNPDVLMGLAELYAVCGRIADARATAAQALEIAETTDPSLIPMIRARLEHYSKTAARPNY
jgi:tetratricopeptide (TPR) repeat protein